MPRWFYWTAALILIAGALSIAGIVATRQLGSPTPDRTTDESKRNDPSTRNSPNSNATRPDEQRSLTKVDESNQPPVSPGGISNSNVDPSNIIRALPDGSVLLSASTAQLQGGPRYLPADGTPAANEAADTIVGWTATSGVAQWDFETDRSGLFEVEVVYAAQPAPIPATYVVEFDTYKLPPQIVRSSGGWTEFLTEYPGTIRLAPAGRHTLRIISANVESVPLMNLRSVRLLPAADPK